MISDTCNFPRLPDLSFFFYQTLMEKRIQPWISKKILEYIGEEEPTLVEFICSKVFILM